VPEPPLGRQAPPVGDVQADRQRGEDQERRGDGPSIPPQELRAAVGPRVGPRADWFVMEVPSQVVAEGRGRCVPVARILPERLDDDRVDVAPEGAPEPPVGNDIRRAGRVRLGDRLDDFGG
jgi:hypothetical protein